MKDDYGFVSFEQVEVQRESFEAYTHERLRPDRCHGEWTFRLTNATAMLINTGTDENGFPKERKGEKTWLKSKHPGHEGQPVIPGSSLKGMIRSLYECLTHSCLFQVAGKYSDYQRKGKVLEPQPMEVPPLYPEQYGLRPCKDVNQLCPACRLFGTVPPGKNAVAWKGRVFIGDGLLDRGQDTQMGRLTLPILSTPRPKGRPDSQQYPDYFPGGSMAGRKRYQARTRTKTVVMNHHRRTHDSGLQETSGETLKPNNHFTVRVRYQNLTHAEVGMLLHTILLEKGQRHLLGTAKAHGWGACHLKLKSWQTIDPEARYRGETGIKDLTEQERREEARRLLAKAANTGLYHPAAFENLRNFLTPASI